MFRRNILPPLRAQVRQHPMNLKFPTPDSASVQSDDQQSRVSRFSPSQQRTVLDQTGETFISASGNCFGPLLHWQSPWDGKSRWTIVGARPVAQSTALRPFTILSNWYSTSFPVGALENALLHNNSSLFTVLDDPWSKVIEKKESCELENSQPR